MAEQKLPEAETDAPPLAEAGEIIEVEGSWEEVNAHFFAQNWTDGLPIVPPTEARVLAMTDYVEGRLGLHKEEQVGVLQPRNGEATVEKIAVNAVMAGCKKEYMPLLIATVRGMAAPEFNLFAVQTSTHNTSVFTLVNGPLREELDINWGYNTVGSRWQSTVTIGRAIRLVMTNIGGIGGATNLHTQGHIGRFEHCVAENEGENPWEPLHVERGFGSGESTVTIFAACPAMMIDENSGSRTAEDLLNTFAHSVAYVGNRNTNGEGEPLIVLCPTHARQLARGGYSKNDFKQFLWENARVPLEHFPLGNLDNFSKRYRSLYCGEGGPAAVPIADSPDDIAVVVMGGQGTHSLSVQTLLGSRSQTVPVPVPIAGKGGRPLP